MRDRIAVVAVTSIPEIFALTSGRYDFSSLHGLFEGWPTGANLAEDFVIFKGRDFGNGFADEMVAEKMHTPRDCPVSVRASLNTRDHGAPSAISGILRLVNEVVA